MKLFYFEWRKFILRKYILVFLLLLSLVDISKIVLDQYQGEIDRLSREDAVNKKAYEEMYNYVKGEITEEKIRFVDAEEERLMEIRMKKMGSHVEGEKTYSGNLYEDCRILMQYISADFRRCAGYEEYSRKLETLAKENVIFYEERNNPAERKVNEYIARTYNNRRINAYYRTESMGKYFTYTFSSMLMIVMCFLGIAPMYSSEREIHMWDILETTCGGRRHREAVKIAAALLYGMTMAVWFRLLDFLVFQLLSGMEGLDNPIWSVTGFEDSPLNCSMGNYILYDMCLKALSLGVIALVVLLLSLCMKKIIHVAIGFAALLGVWILMANGMNSLQEIKRAWALCSPLVLLDCSRLICKFIHIEAGNHFIRGEVLAEVMAGAFILLQMLVLRLSRGREPAAGKGFRARCSIFDRGRKN